jgi:hypothetical protein
MARLRDSRDVCSSGSNPPATARACATVVALLAVITSRGALAENMRDVPLGGRTAAMGGAGVASGSDAAMPYLNPAGVAGTPHDIVSVTASVYSGLGATVDDFYAPEGLDARYGDAEINEDFLEQNHLAVLPSAVTYFRRFGAGDDPYRHVIALSLLAPSASQIDVTGRFRAAGTDHRLTADNLGQDRFRQVFGGPTYALTAWGRRFRFGVSVFVTYADLVADEHQLTLARERSAGADTLATTNERSIVDVTSWGLTTILGAQLRLFDHLWAGVAGESRGWSVWGSGSRLSVLDRARTEAGISTQSRFNSEGQLDDVSISRPFRMSGGLAYDRPDLFALAVDLHFTPAHDAFREWRGVAHVTRAQSGADVNETDEALYYRRGSRDTVNFSVGGEVHLTRKVTLRAGMYTDKDIVEESTPGDETRNARLDWTVYTLGLGMSSGVVGTSYGIAYRRGSGTAYPRDTFGADPTRVAEVDYTAHGLMLMLAGAVTTDEDK